LRFRTFIIFAVAILALLGGYTFAKLEGQTASNHQQIVQHSEDNCKLKLYDLASGYEQQARLRRTNPREAAVLAGALRVVLSIPSAKNCVPAVRFALEHSHGHGRITRLTPAVERELVRLAGSTPPAEGRSHPPHAGRGVGGGRRPAPRQTPTPSPPREAPPSVTVTVPVPTPAPAEPLRGHGKAKAPVPTPPPKVEEPSITTPSVEVPPITVETPAVKTPCVQVGPVAANCKKEN